MKQLHKVIFLDVDGVLKTGDFEQQIRKEQQLTYLQAADTLQPEKIELLVRLVRETDAKIVLSSTWRLWKPNYNIVARALDKHGISIFSKTPDKREESRWDEIKTWLQTRPPCQSLVIDDDETAYNKYEAPSNCKFIHVDNTIGLTEYDIQRGIKLLGQHTKILEEPS